jgi:hypothetical protein
VPASDYRALQSQVRELQRLLGKKTLEAEILKEAFEHATGSKKSCGCRRWLPMRGVSVRSCRSSVDGVSTVASCHRFLNFAQLARPLCSVPR